MPLRGRDYLRGGHCLFVVLVVAVILAAPAAVASWTQVGHDAARTSHSSGPGPMAPDVAFHIPLPGYGGMWNNLATLAGPLIHDGGAYVAVWAEEDWANSAGERLDFEGVVRVDLATSNVERVVSVQGDRRPLAIAMDEVHLFVLTSETVEAYRISDWDLVWSWPHYDPFPDAAATEQTDCAQPAVSADLVYAACMRYAFDSGAPRAASFLVALDASTGEERWIWVSPDPGSDGFIGNPATDDDPARPGVITFIGGFSVIDPGLYAMGLQVQVPGVPGPVCDPDENEPCPDTSFWVTKARFRMMAFDAFEGDFQWDRNVDVGDSELRVDGESSNPYAEAFGEMGALSPHPTGEANVVYVRLQDEIHALHPRDGEPLWEEPVVIGREDALINSTAQQGIYSSFALSGEALFTKSAETVYRIDRENPRQGWSTSLDPSRNERFVATDLVRTDGVLYAEAASEDWRLPRVLYAFDAEEGDVLWRHEIPREPGGWCCTRVPSAGEGVIALASTMPALRVLGTTEASIRPAAEVSSRIPMPGEPVTVDLSGSEPGRFGDPSRFRADWGDGTVTDWNTTPRLTHTYAESGEVRARFVVGNEQNQTASIFVVFEVGAPRPEELNLLQRMFARDNQDLTFGVLGIMVALSGGAAGVIHRQRKRSRLQDELDALDRLFEQTRGLPVECEAQLTERKAHARGLLTGGTLSEEQFRVIENRIDELRKQLRHAAVEEEFDFMPYRLVKKAREMLEDGRVTGLESEAFLRALEEDQEMSPTQKAQVRGRIETWLTRDSGGGGAEEPSAGA